ncbi:MAG: hypothetical protein Q9224_003344, partial [Gallowayella concinna]
VVKLNPQDHKNDFTRVITLSPSSNSIYIGRASKTPSKGLVAAPENAWFDSPIMSRHHGKISVTASGVIQLKDLASTHGTFIRLKRLEANKTYELHDGDRLTFGSTVTSGPLTYHARSFIVEIPTVDLPASCGQQEPPSSTCSKGSKRSGFSIPDDDLYESLSDDSEEEDCKIVDSHPRTFSVPSSGDDQDDSDDSDDDDDLALYTSRGIGSAPRNALDQNRTYVGDTLVRLGVPEQRTRAESTAGSAMDPIELEKVSPELNGIIDDTEDEGSSDLEQQTRVRVSKQANTYGDDVSASAPYTVIPDTYASFGPSKQDSLPHEEVGGKGIVQHEVPTDATLDRNKLGQRQDIREHRDLSSIVDTYNEEATASTCDNSILDSELVNEHLRKPIGAVAFDLDQHRSLLCQQEKESPLLQRIHAATDPSYKDSMINGSESPEAEPAKEYTTEEESEYDNDEDGVFVEPASVMRDPVPSMIINGGEDWSPESPVSSHSPSESPFVHHFLARANATRSTHLTQPKPAELRPNPFENVASPRSFWLESQSKTLRAPSPSDAALARNGASMQAECHNNFIYDDHMQGFPIHPLQPFRRPAIAPAIAEHQIPSQGYTLASTRHDKTFEPHFRVDHLTPTSYPPQSWNGGWSTDRVPAFPAEHAVPNEYDQGPFSRTYGSFHTVANPQITSRQADSPPPQKSCLVRLKLDAKTVDGHSDLSHQILDPAKSSKVDISNLVNPHADGARGLKRKSDQISANEVVSGIADGVSQDSSEHSSSKDDLGPHAQARDTTIAVNDMISQGLTRDLTQVPISVVAGAAEEGPVRKRTKISTPKAGSVGKFVSGICLGLAGAFAAFLAATPSDVWDEALREAVKLA